MKTKQRKKQSSISVFLVECLFAMQNAANMKNRIGNRYSIDPNSPKKKEENRFPAFPQMPKLLMISSTLKSRQPVIRISDLTFGFIGSLTGAVLTGSFTGAVLRLRDAAVLLLREDPVEAALEEELPDFLLGCVEEAAGFFVVFGLVF